MRKNNGITLIALVITIVVLIILASVAITLSLGDNGVFKKAAKAKEDTLVAQNEEAVELAKTTNSIDEITSSSRNAASKTVLFDTVTSATTTTSGIAKDVALNDDIKKYNYLVINIAWRYQNGNDSQNRQYFLDTSLIEKRNDSNTILDYAYMYGYSSCSDYVGITFLENNKMRVFINGVSSGCTVAVTKVIGVN